MSTPKEHEKLSDYISSQKLKQSHKRLTVLKAISASPKRHLTAHEVLALLNKKRSGIGQATVYRSLRLLCDAGVLNELRCEDGSSRYEFASAGSHHDHLICTKCGRFVEVFDPEIERLQDKLFARHGFYPERHKLELYGVCRMCKR
ncbi:MAG: transcriptional repressor [Candidatus Omnitrophica bacterium]|nr:transcriptional repressor [Candidatus Omnitrophota bacterium]